MRKRRLHVLVIAALFLVSAAIALNPGWSTAPLPVQVRPFTFVNGLVEPGNTYFEFRNIAGNLALYMLPAAAAMLLLRSVVAVTLLTAAVAAVVEAAQLVIGGRVVDIDDIILAAFGALIAAAVTGAVSAHHRRPDVASVDESPMKRNNVIIVASAAVLLIAFGAIWFRGFSTSTQAEMTTETPDPTGMLDDDQRNQIAAFLGDQRSDALVVLRAELVTEFEDAIATCMRREGFTYPPGLVTDTSDADVPRHVDAEGRSVPDPDYISNYGYGIVAASLSLQGVPIGGRIPKEPTGPYDVVEDLPAAEREEFYVALEGHRYDPSLPETDEGCYGAALRATGFGRVKTAMNEFRTRFREEVDERLAADPRIAKLEEDWQECIAGHGFQARWSPDLVDEIWVRLRELDETNAPVDAYFELLEYEKQMAKADIVLCGGGPIADQVYDAVRREIELDVVEQNAGWYLSLLEE